MCDDEMEDDDAEEEEDEEKVCDSDVPPVVITTYVNSDTSETMVLVLLTLPSGVTSCHVAIDPDSMCSRSGGTNKIMVSYEWGDYSFKPLMLYKSFLQKGVMSKDHPKIQAIYNGLKKFRDNIEQAPKSTVHITLPIQVQVADNKWSYNTIANKDDNGFTTQVIEIELTELQTSYISIKANKKAMFKLEL